MMAYRKKYNAACDKVSADIKKVLDGEHVSNKKILQTKIKSDGDEATDFHYKKCLRKVLIMFFNSNLDGLQS